MSQTLDTSQWEAYGETLLGKRRDSVYCSLFNQGGSTEMWEEADLFDLRRIIT